MIEIRTKIVDGKVTRNRNLLLDAFASMEGKEVVVSIKRVKKQRSNPQNAYYWGCCLSIMQNALKDAGHLMSVNDVHDLLKLRLLKETILINEETGECVERIKSTTELSTTGMMEYFMDIQRFAIEYFGVTIPDPNEEVTLKFEQ
jgi:hypothetical protein